MPAAGILGWKRSKYQRPILHNSKSPETPRKLFLEIIKNIERKKYIRGPCWPSGAHLLLYEVFRLRKIISKLTGRNSAATRRNLGGTNLGLRRSCSAGETSLREGEIITIVITNDPLIGRGSISINIFTSTISSQTLVHLLCSILLPELQIGACG